MRPELAQFADEVRASIPDGAEIIDVHTHLGTDEDGMSLDPEGLLRQLDHAGIRRACVFALHDPERVPAYRTPNDRVLAWAGESGGRLVPFCRLDPSDGAAAEAERCLELGARGIKLHPRAHATDFADGAVEEIFRLAAQARVPVLVHAGRGMAPIAEPLCAVALRHPDAPLILAHAGIADQAVFATRLAEHPAAFFDSSVFGPLDLVELYARVPAERIIFGSDPPYGRPLLGLYVTVRAARAAGVDEAGMRALLGATTAGILAGTPLPPPAAPLRPRVISVPGALARISMYAALAFAALADGRVGVGREHVEMARSVCRDPAPGSAGPALERLAMAFDAVATAFETPGARIPRDVVYLAMALAATEPPPPT